jgi:hypothetical protein
MPRMPSSRQLGAGLASAAALLVALLAGGCSNKARKLNEGGDFMSQVYYGLLGGERDPSYYYSMVRDSHDAESFAYRPSEDPYLVDKNVDALVHLGDVPFARLEGLSNTVSMLVEVVLEDRSALARSAAAVSLTKIASRLPRYGRPGPTDDGSLLASAMAEIQGAYGTGRLAAGFETHVADRIRAIGEATYDPGVYAKKALQFFGTTPHLIDETQPRVREALDTAMTRTARQAAVYALTAAIEGPTDYVRADAVRGLKVLGELGAVEAVASRVAVEVSPRVRSEAAEYFARAASPDAVAALLPMLDDVDGSVRFKSRQALAQIAGEDRGGRRGPWQRWAEARWPGDPAFAAPADALPAAAGP